jgi:hypothetical protein
MLKSTFAPLALAGLLVASLPAFSQEMAVQPDQDEAPASDPAADEGQAPEAAAPAEGGGAMMMPGMMGQGMSGQGKAGQGMMGPGMMGQGKMGQGMKGCRTGMGGMKGMKPGSMGQGGMMGMGAMKGCSADHCDMSKKQYRELMGRLDVLEARMAKIDAMLERLLER